MDKVLLISNYFPPEMGAASNRIFQMAKMLSSSYNVTVICPLPNYPTGKIFDDYKFKETIDGIHVRRLRVYPSNSKNRLVRLFSMLSFSFSLFWYILRHEMPKTVIVNSPPLLVAFTSLLFMPKRKHKLILNVSDLWPKAGLELGAIKKGIGYSILKKMESYNYRKADVILGQSKEILNHITLIVPQKNTLLYRNFPDFVPPKLKIKDKSEEDNIKIVYAGLLGIAQGVLMLCKNLDFNNIELHIYGSGAEEEQIKTYIANNPQLPIIFHGSFKRDKLHSELLKYDATIVPLLHRIYGSVPSKIFEYARLGLPIIYFGGGEGESIVQKNNLGWVAESGDYNALNRLLRNINSSVFTLKRKQEIQQTAIRNFNSKQQLNDLQRVL